MRTSPENWTCVADLWTDGRRPWATTSGAGSPVPTRAPRARPRRQAASDCSIRASSSFPAVLGR
jgi:hypothetical protein